MADAKGYNPGDPGYNAYTDPSSPLYTPPGTVGGSATPTNGSTTDQGTTVVNPTGPPQSIQDAFTAFVSNPAYRGGGQAAIDAFAQKYPQYAGVVAWNPARSVYELPGGYLTNLPGGTGSWSFTPTGPEAGTGTGGGAFSIDPSYLAPFTEKFAAPGDPTNPASAAGVLNPQSFELPTEADLFGSPGYKGAQDAATQAVITSNAAKGLVNSGGNIFDLANVTAGLEGQQYNDLVNQKASRYGINLGAGQQSFNDAWQQYLNKQNVFYQNQTNPFNKISTIANLGLTAAGNAG